MSEADSLELTDKETKMNVQTHTHSCTHTEVCLQQTVCSPLCEPFESLSTAEAWSWLCTGVGQRLPAGRAPFHQGLCGSLEPKDHLGESAGSAPPRASGDAETQPH